MYASSAELAMPEGVVSLEQLFMGIVSVGIERQGQMRQLFGLAFVQRQGQRSSEEVDWIELGLGGFCRARTHVEQRSPV